MDDRFDEEAEKLLPWDTFSCETADEDSWEKLVSAVAAWGREISEELNKFWCGAVAERDERITEIKRQLARAERDWQEERQAAVELRKQLETSQRFDVKFEHKGEQFDVLDWQARLQKWLGIERLQHNRAKARIAELEQELERFHDKVAELERVNQTIWAALTPEKRHEINLAAQETERKE